MFQARIMPYRGPLRGCLKCSVSSFQISYQNGTTEDTEDTEGTE